MRVHLFAGKSTLLQILAGQYMVGPDVVRILGRPAFHDIQLTSSGQLSYLGQQWRRDVAFAGYNVPLQVHIIWRPTADTFLSPWMMRRSAVSTALPCAFAMQEHSAGMTCHGSLRTGLNWHSRRHARALEPFMDMQGDIGAGKMIFGVEGVDPARRQHLIDLLEIDLEWRLNKVSDGQRRRVQICMGLLKPYQVTPPARQCIPSSSRAQSSFTCNMPALQSPRQVASAKDKTSCPQSSMHTACGSCA